MAPVYFLSIDGIPGGSRDREHPDEIKLESFSWGESAAPPGEPIEVSFTALSSPASPALLLACADARRVASAVLTMRDPEARTEPSRRWRFTDVAVSEYSASVGVMGPVDRVTLRAASVEALAPVQRPSLRLEIVRPDDLLNIEVEAVNLRLDADSHEPTLVADDP